MVKKRFRAAAIAAALALFAVCGLAACGPADTAAPADDAGKAPVTVRVASMKGPTSIGLLDLMARADAGDAPVACSFDVVGTADEVVKKVVAGDVDVALVPANVAAVLYQKTDGEVQAVDINTLSVLECVTADASVTDVASLAGRTVYLTGKGATPQYVMEYLLSKAGVADQVTLEYKSEATEVVAALAADPSAVAVLPQPYATAALSKVSGARTAFGLGDAWKAVAPEGSELVTGVTVVRAEFLAEHPDEVRSFVDAQKASVEAVLADPASAAEVAVEKGIVDNEALAEKAIQIGRAHV